MSQDPITVPVWYDFASTLCYVTHRVMERMAPALAEQELILDWQPLDLTQLLGPYRRGEPMPEDRRTNARRVADDLGVAVEAPAVWHDSRSVGAAAIALAGTPHEESWRERVFTAFFEERLDAPGDDGVLAWFRDLGWTLAPDALSAGRERLSTRTEVAREAMVTGVPTFMLGEWPFGGIQTEETMEHVLRRYAARIRQRTQEGAR